MLDVIYWTCLLGNGPELFLVALMCSFSPKILEMDTKMIKFELIVVMITKRLRRPSSDAILITHFRGAYFGKRLVCKKSTLNLPE